MTNYTIASAGSSRGAALTVPSRKTFAMTPTLR